MRPFQVMASLPEPIMSSTSHAYQKPSSVLRQSALPCEVIAFESGPIAPAGHCPVHVPPLPKNLSSAMVSAPGFGGVISSDRAGPATRDSAPIESSETAVTYNGSFFMPSPPVVGPRTACSGNERKDAAGAESVQAVFAEWPPALAMPTLPTWGAGIASDPTPLTLGVGRTN